MTERKTKPRSRGLINATGVDLLPRHLGRIKTLRLAIEKAKGREQHERVESLKAELDGRLAAIEQIKKDLESIEA